MLGCFLMGIMMLVVVVIAGEDPVVGTDVELAARCARSVAWNLGKAEGTVHRVFHPSLACCWSFTW